MKLLKKKIFASARHQPLSNTQFLEVIGLILVQKTTGQSQAAESLSPEKKAGMFLHARGHMPFQRPQHKLHMLQAAHTSTAETQPLQRTEESASARPSPASEGNEQQQPSWVRRITGLSAHLANGIGWKQSALPQVTGDAALSSKLISRHSCCIAHNLRSDHSLCCSGSL